MSAPSTPDAPSHGGTTEPTTGWRDAVARHPWLWATAFAFGLTSFVVFGLRPFLRHIPDPPDVQLHLPKFSLISQSGSPFGSNDLDGSIWIADFFFTSCPSICAELTRRMKRLQDAFEREGVPARLVSISVDPINDTPARLREYAQKHGADPSRWTFLTGPEESVRALVTDGFKTHVGRPELMGANIIDIAHASYFVLVDSTGGVRAYYDAMDDEELSRAFHEARNLLRYEREHVNGAVHGEEK